MTDEAQPFLAWFFSSLREVILRPRQFFLTQATTPVPVNRAILFGFICLLVGTAGQSWLEMGLAAASSQALASDPEAFQKVLGLMSLPPGEQSMSLLTERLHSYRAEKWLALLISPISAYFSIYLIGSLMWVLSKFYIGYKGSYDSILCLVGLAQAPLIFSLIPLLGPLIAMMWSWVLLSIGLKSLQESRLLARILLLFLPVFLVKSMWTFAITLLAASAP